MDSGHARRYLRKTWIAEVKSRRVTACEIFIRKFNATDSSFQRKLESRVFHALQGTGSQLSLG